MFFLSLFFRPGKGSSSFPPGKRGPLPVWKWVGLGALMLFASSAKAGSPSTAPASPAAVEVDATLPEPSLSPPSPQPAAEAPLPSGGVHILSFRNHSMNAGTRAWLGRGLAQAAEDGASLVLIELDTPGGLLDSTREMVMDIRASQVPVVVWIGPSGARAGSAGVFLSMAAGKVAMAPGTHIGAAHPVSLFGTSPPPSTEGGTSAASEMEQKILNDTLAWVDALCQDRGRPREWCRDAVAVSRSTPVEEALKLGVADFLAADRASVFRALEGQVIPVASGKRTLPLSLKETAEVPLSLREALVNLLSSPDLLYLLMALGMLGLFGEISHPGAILPGIVGVGCLLAAGVGLAILPFNIAGLLLIFFGFILLVLEIWVTSFGLLAVAGIASLLGGGLLLFDAPGSPGGVHPATLATVGILVGAAVLGVGILLARAQRRPITTGLPGMLGQRGTVTEEFLPHGDGYQGWVFVRGELWKGQGDKRLLKGQAVRVVRADGLTLAVEMESENSL